MDDDGLGRRGLLLGGLAAATLTGLTACGGTAGQQTTAPPVRKGKGRRAASPASPATDSTEPPAPPMKDGQRKISYGAGSPDQHCLLRLPKGPVRGTAVLVHGGGWTQDSRADQLDPMSMALAAIGYATWNVEYRRVGGSGGWPMTFEDMAAAVDRLASLTAYESGTDPRGLLRRVVLIGYSAGGQLVTWAGSRNDRTPGGAPKVVPDAVISLSGELNLTLAAEPDKTEGEVPGLMGGTPAQVPRRYALGDPTRLVPAPMPVYVAQAIDDGIVPPEQATTYVAAARAAGGMVQLINVAGDHIGLPFPDGPAWPAILDLVHRAMESPNP